MILSDLPLQLLSSGAQRKNMEAVHLRPEVDMLHAKGSCPRLQLFITPLSEGVWEKVNYNGSPNL